MGRGETGRDQKTRTDSKEEQEMEYKDQRVLSGKLGIALERALEHSRAQS